MYDSCAVKLKESCFLRCNLSYHFLFGYWMPCCPFKWIWLKVTWARYPRNFRTASRSFLSSGKSNSFCHCSFWCVVFDVLNIWTVLRFSLFVFVWSVRGDGHFVSNCREWSLKYLREMWNISNLWNMIVVAVVGHAWTCSLTSVACRFLEVARQ